MVTEAEAAQAVVAEPVVVTAREAAPMALVELSVQGVRVVALVVRTVARAMVAAMVVRTVAREMVAAMVVPKCGPSSVSSKTPHFGTDVDETAVTHNGSGGDGGGTGGGLGW